MLTPQDITTKEFEKVAFGGYDKGAVEEFFARVGSDYQRLYKENTEYKGKLKVLADKIEEYRRTEDVMHQALLSAQKIAQDLEIEAKRKYDELIQEAEDTARRRIEALKLDVVDQEARLAKAQKETAEFTTAAGIMIDKLSVFLKNVNSLSFAQNAAQAVKKQEKANTISAAVQGTKPEKSAPEQISISGGDSEDEDVRPYISSAEFEAK
ncbi:MAG: DivIVA domain-containing protein [Oscillospiraceae bacterium]|jgi:cell division initiation protein|nr:DivIVA domain-containing protein [Oscillospiraceae bacterium]